MSDQEILQLLRDGKVHPAIKKVYNYFPVVRKFIVANNGSKQGAEDVFQDALVIFINKVKDERFELTSAIDTYLFSVCRFIWLEQLRAKQKEIKNTNQVKFEFYQNDALENDVKSDATLKQAQRAIESLGEKCQEILTLFYFNKWSMKAIAEKLKFSSEKVAKNQKYRCIEKAKQFAKTNI